MAKTKRTEIATAIAGLVATTKDQHKLAQAIAAYLVANHKDYLQWMAGGDFAEDTKKLIGEALNGKLKKEPAGMLGSEQ
jgi:hypothetical protein